MKKYVFNDVTYDNIDGAVKQSLYAGYFGESELEKYLEENYSVFTLFLKVANNKYSTDEIMESAIECWTWRAYKMERYENYEDLELDYGIIVKDVEV